MNIGEILRNNYEEDAVKPLLTALNIFTLVDYTAPEDELELLIHSNSNIGVNDLLGDIDNKLNEYLIYIAQEHGLVLNPDYNASTHQLNLLVKALLDLQKFEDPESILNLIEAVDDEQELLVRLMELVVVETVTGNLYDYYNIVVDFTTNFFRNLGLVVEGTLDKMVNFEEFNFNDLKDPMWKGEVWNWIRESGRINYDVDAAFNLLEERITPENRPSREEIQSICYELKTLVVFGNIGDMSAQEQDDKVRDLFTALYPDDLELEITLAGVLPYVQLFED